MKGFATLNKRPDGSIAGVFTFNAPGHDEAIVVKITKSEEVGPGMYRLSVEAHDPLVLLAERVLGRIETVNAG